MLTLGDQKLRQDVLLPSHAFRAVKTAVFHLRTPKSGTQFVWYEDKHLKLPLSAMYYQRKDYKVWSSSLQKTKYHLLKRNGSSSSSKRSYSLLEDRTLQLACNLEIPATPYISRLTIESAILTPIQLQAITNAFWSRSVNKEYRHTKMCAQVYLNRFNYKLYWVRRVRARVVLITVRVVELWMVSAHTSLEHYCQSWTH